MITVVELGPLAPEPRLSWPCRSSVVCGRCPAQSTI